MSALLSLPHLFAQLSLDGKGGDDGSFDQSGKKTLADQYEYVMYGKVYKCDEDKAKFISYVYASYGGLLMCLKGDTKLLEEIHQGTYVYLLMRKANK